MQNTRQKNAGVYRIDKTLNDGCNQSDEALDMYNNVGIKDIVNFIN